MIFLLLFDFTIRKSARTVSDGTELRSSTQAKATRDLIQYLPLDQREIEYASQSTLLRLTVNYVKIKRVIEELGKHVLTLS